MELNFEHIVTQAMKIAIEKFNLHVIKVSQYEILLKSETYILKYLAERDGVSLIYFDISKEMICGYNIFLFLIGNRRNRLVFLKSRPVNANFSDFIQSEVVALAGHLHRAGEDILEGSKDWIRFYRGQTLSADMHILNVAAGSTH